MGVASGAGTFGLGTLSASELHKEKAVQRHFISQLVKLQGWVVRPATAYDKALALDPEMIAQYVANTQPAMWARIQAHFPGQAVQHLTKQVRRTLDSVGTLTVLRDKVKGKVKFHPGFEVDLCGLLPSSRMNTDLVAAYKANILSVMEEVVYSTKGAPRIDTVLFVNGIPVATIEFKNTMTKGPNGKSCYTDAENQYRKDRPPHNEPLLTLKTGALVHFAIDDRMASMTTELKNGHTRFLPFNKGRNGGAGNPAPAGDAAGEFPIAYFYRDMDGEKAVFSREVILDIIEHFALYVEETKNGKKTRTMTWPRLHQLRAVRGMVAHAKCHGAGHNYLIQHSAGSGKSNTIAWTAYHLSNLHDDQDKAVFDAVIIVTDRLVLDQQLQKTVKSFVSTPGYVAAIDGTSKQLREAIAKGARIIISTIHKFSTDTMAGIRNHENKRFAILIDEAHSSQSGKHADSMHKALTAHNSGINDQDDVSPILADAQQQDSLEKALISLQKERGPAGNLSHFAFTATPRNVTMERFGTKGPDGLPHPFDTYSMRQAIEEGFILDVLKNHQTYEAYYKLESRVADDPTFNKQKAKRRVARYASLHEGALAKKAEVIVGHYRRHGLPELNGHGKAMVVAAGREAAVRLLWAIQDHLTKEGITDVHPMVAFSGEITIDGHTYTEEGINGFSEKMLPSEFEEGPHNLLIVAEKYQTGFDQPKLVAMYVDRKLDDLQAVQTLSRLNRTMPGKHRTFVLDFRNTADDIRAAFAPYFDTTAMEATTDPNEIYSLRSRLFATNILEGPEIAEFVRIFVLERPTENDRPRLQALLQPAIDRFHDFLDEAQQEEFRQGLASYGRFYSFLAAVIDLQDTDLEQLHIYGSWLCRALPDRIRPTGDNVTDDMLSLSAFRLVEKDAQSIAINEGRALEPITDFGANPYTADEEAALSDILKAFNERYGTNFTKEDMIRLDQLGNSLLEDENLRELLASNPVDDTLAHFTDHFFSAMIAMFHKDKQMQNILLQDQDARDQMMKFAHQRAVRLAKSK
jgi:type I restriction enzyme R subunit